MKNRLKLFKYSKYGLTLALFSIILNHTYYGLIRNGFVNSFVYYIFDTIYNDPSSGLKALIIIELLLMFGIWNKTLYKYCHAGLIIIAICGITLSLIIIIINSNLDCGCGFIKSSPILILFQKFLFLFLIISSYKSKDFF